VIASVKWNGKLEIIAEGETRTSTGSPRSQEQDIVLPTRQISFRYIREEISDGLYDYIHRIPRFVHVSSEMAAVPGKKMRCSQVRFHPPLPDRFITELKRILFGRYRHLLGPSLWPDPVSTKPGEVLWKEVVPDPARTIPRPQHIRYPPAKP